jgi:Protein of unknown function (DUF998)
MSGGVGGRVALAGVGGLTAGAVLIVLLALVPPTDRISVTRQTMSQYGLSGNAWVFNLAVLLVAAGSVAIIAVLRTQRRLPPLGVLFGALWTVGLLLIVSFPKSNFAVANGSALSGTVHRSASVVAFVFLPLAVLAAARAAFPDSPGRRLAVRLLAAASLAWFGVILAAIVIGAVQDLRWWTVIPLGLVERGMALTELVALTALAIPVRGTVPATPELVGED